MRRDQRRLRLLLILLTLTSLTLVTLDVRGGAGGLGSARGLVRDIVNPIESALSTVWRPIKNAASSVVHLGRDRETAKRLAKENADLRGQLEKFQQEDKDRKQTDSLLLLASRGQYKIVGAKVISLGDVTGYEWTALIDVGSKDGVKKDMTVTTGEGLVGRIISTTSGTSVVLLIVDAKSAVGARIEGPGTLSTLEGHGREPLRFSQLSKSPVLKPGQRVVTYGSTFSAGVPIGTITKIVTSPNGLSRDALVEPFVNMETLDIVGVIVESPRTDPRDAVLPPKQTPTPSATPKVSGSPSPGATGTTGTTGTSGTSGDSSTGGPDSSAGTSSGGGVSPSPTPGG